MATVERDGERIVIDCAYHERELAKQVPGARWDKDNRTWWAPLSWAACQQLRGIFGSNLVIGPQLFAWASNEVETRIDPCLRLRVDLGPGGEWSHQGPAIEFLRTAGSALLTSEMGCGKGVIIARLLEQLGRDAFPVLVVCPNSMKGAWEKELERWTPSATVSTVRGTAVKRRAAIEAGADVTIINWESLRSHTRLSGYGSIRLKKCVECGGTDKTCEVHPRELNRIAWSTIIADEVHRAKTPAALQTRALWAVSRGTQRRYGLTGTPIAQNPADLWAPAHFIDPVEWPTHSAFIERYALQSWNHWGGMEIVGIKPEHKTEFFKILDPRMRRDKLEVVMPYLPKKPEPIVREVELSTVQRRTYNGMNKEMLVQLPDDTVLVETQRLTKALRLYQLANSMLDANGEPVEPSSKIDELLDVIDEASGPVVVFFESRRLLNLVEERFRRKQVSFVSVHGKIGEVQRTENVDRFQAGEVQALLATYAAGSEGLTLTRAHAIVRFQRTANLVHDLQSVGRVFRGGLDHEAQIIDLVAVNTLEDERAHGVENKARMLEEILRDKEALKRVLEATR